MAKSPTVSKKDAIEASERMSGWDFATWRSGDSPIMRSTMIGLLVLEKAPDWKRLVDRYDRASREVPILRKKVIEGPVAIANPRLVVDPNFDLSFHIRRFRMPEGATWDDVLEDARRQSMTDFDKDRPLWRVTVLEGLPGGKAAVISKLHHAIADGQGALQLGAALVDLTPDGKDLGPMPPEPESSDLTPSVFAETMVRDNVSWMLSTANDMVKNAVPTAMNLLTDPVGTLGNLYTTASSLIRFSNTPLDSLSPLMTRRSINYHFDTFDFPFAELKTGAKETGHTVNDGFLAAVAEGLGEYHRKLNRPVDKLNISMPISLRKPGDGAENAVTIARFELPTEEGSLIKRMDQVSAIVKKWRAEPALGFANQIGEISRFVPMDIVNAAAQATDVTASNVPGIPIPVYLAGAKVERMYPLPPTIGAAVFIAMLTYDGIAQIGIASDDAAIENRELLVKCFKAGFTKVTGKPVISTSPLSTRTSGSIKKRSTVKKTTVKRAAKKASPKKATKKPTKATKKVAPRKSTVRKTPAKRTPTAK